MSGRWFRFYDAALDDPKVQKLAPKYFKAWINLLCLASRNDGEVPSIDDIAFAIRVAKADAEDVFSHLFNAGLLDRDEDGRVTPHNWSSRQYKSDGSAERMRRHRDRHRNGASDVTVTPSESDTESETETEAEKEAFAAFVDAAARRGWTKPQSLTADRRPKLRARLRDHGLDGWKAAVTRAETSALINDPESGWWSIDWLLKPGNFTKVIEGNYDGRKAAPAAVRFNG